MKKYLPVDTLALSLNWNLN